MKTTRNPLPMAAFGARLRDLRRERKLTQQMVAEYLQIHRTTYTKYEAGTVAPDYMGLIRLADIFGVSVDCLLGRKPLLEYMVVANEEEIPVPVNAQELMLLQRYRQLSLEEQQRVADMACDAADGDGA